MEKIKYNGKAYSEKQMANIVNENVQTCATPFETIREQVAWMKANCKNLNDVNACNVLVVVWYDIKGVSSKHIQQAIGETVAEFQIPEY